MCDIEISPGPDKNYKSLICCRWNVNGLTPHNIILFINMILFVLVEHA